MVGSIEYEIGIPQTIGFLKIRETENDATILIAFNVRLKVRYLKRFISNWILFCVGQDKQLVEIVKDWFKAIIKMDLTFIRNGVMGFWNAGFKNR